MENPVQRAFRCPPVLRSQAGPMELRRNALALSLLLSPALDDVTTALGEHCSWLKYKIALFCQLNCFCFCFIKNSESPPSLSTNPWDPQYRPTVAAKIIRTLVFSPVWQQPALHTEIWSHHHPVCLWHEETEQTETNPEELWQCLQDASRKLPAKLQYC